MEESQTNQQPAKVEGEADVLDLPVGLVSGSLASVSAETLENPAPPLQENLTGEMEETIEHLMKTLLNEVETNVEQRLNEMDMKKNDPPEEDAESTKRNIRRGTRGKGRRIGYERDNDPRDGAKNEIRVSAHRTGAEGLRGQCRNVQEQRKTPPETPRPKAHPHHQQRMMERHEEKREHPQWKREQGQRTQQGFSERRSSGQRNVRKNWGDECRQVFHPRQVQKEMERRPDRKDSRVPAPRGGTEGLRGQCRNEEEKRKTPPETSRPKTRPHQQHRTMESVELLALVLFILLF
ncbi:hypothetical protein SRHO_G00101640 [Serrasalmus rhombeus]